jgi:hypothetical protein
MKFELQPGGISSLDIEVRLATAQDRALIEEFYVREGKNFQQLIQHSASTPVGPSSETMFVIAVIRNMVVAALKLDIAKDPSIGKVGYIRYFEIEDELESTDLGKKMLEKSDELADDKGLRALNTFFDISRADLFDVYTESGYKEERKEIHLKKDFSPGVFD